MVFVIIFILCASYAHNLNVKQSYIFDDAKMNIIGTVIDISEEQQYYKKYLIKIEEISKNSNLKNKNILLYVKKDSNNKEQIDYGDEILIKSYIEKGEISRNYKGFNYQDFLKTKRICGIVKLENSEIKIIKKNNISIYKRCIKKLHANIKEKIYIILPSTTADMCTAIILGDKSGIDSDVIEVFSNSSLSHILAISGMHMSYIIIIFSTIFKLLGKNKKNIILIIIILIFCNLVGNNESVVRSTIMTIIYISGSLLHKKQDSITSISISACVLLMYNPYLIKSVSFLLSFFGTLGIIMFYKYLNNVFERIKIFNKNKILIGIRECISISISANLLIIPVIAIYYNNLNFIFIISNVLANLLLSIIMPIIVGTIIIAFISIKIAKYIGIILHICISALVFISKISSKFNLVNFIICTPYEISIITYYICIYFYMLKINSKFKKKCFIGKIIRCLLIVYTIICLCISQLKFLEKNMSIYFIDVGQGDSTLIITEENKKILIDGGGNESGEDYIGKNVLFPYLLDRRIIKLDYIMISHFDSDHCKGALYIMEKLNVENVIISEQGKLSENYEKFIEIVKKKRINVISVKAGMIVKIDKSTYFNIIWPKENLEQKNILNNNSIVARLVYGNFNMLFTGDIDQIAEEQITKECNLESNILKVAHHGSNSSSTEEFIRKVNPQIALIGVGKDNKYNHPGDKTISNLNNICKIFRTDCDGEISIKIEKNGNIKVKKRLN